MSTEIMMPSYRIGKMVKYANEPKAHFEPVISVYFTKKSDAQKHLDELIATATEAKDIERMRELVVGRWEEPASVYSLNTLPSENSVYGQRMRDEITQKLKWFGYVTIGWTCLGHTRARWQTSAAVEWARSTHPEWKVADREFECYIEL